MISTVQPDALPFWARPAGVLAIVATYLIAHFALRLSMWPSLGVDDAEQALFAQHFEWSYRYRAPPLFTWLLMGIERVTGGPGLLAISLLRYLLFAVLALFVYLTSRRLLADPRLAALSVYSYAAIYVFGYYSHHDLTHTTAMSAMLAASWYALVRLVETPDWRWYAAFGITCGLGLISKWNFGIFIGGFVIAALLLSDLRRRVLLRPGILLTLLCMALVAGPVAASTIYWGPNNNDNLGSVLGVDADIDSLIHLLAVVKLFGSFLVYGLPFLAIAIVAYWPNVEWRRLAFWQAARRAQAGPVLTAAVFTSFGAALIFVAIALVTGSLKLPERLMQPALFMLPALFLMLVDGRETENRRLSGFALILLVVAIIALGARIGVFINESRDCRHCRANQPYEQLAEELRADGFSGQGTILVKDDHLGGNLRVVFPQARVVDITFPLRYWPAPGEGAGDCLIVRRGATDETALGTPDDRFGRFLTERLGGNARSADAQRTTELKLLGSDTLTRSYSWELFKGGNGDCR